MTETQLTTGQHKDVKFDPELYYYDEAAVDRVVKFFERVLCLTEGEHSQKPFILAPYQLSIVRNLFGVKSKADNLRRYRTAYVQVPRKAGKTHFAAGLALYMLVGDEEPGAKVYCAAGSKQQAKICHSIAKEMINMSPILSKNLISNRDDIFFKRKGKATNFYQALTSNPSSVHGTSPSFAVYDEIHRATNRDLFDSIKKGAGARRQPIFFVITTAGHDMSSICYELFQYSNNVKDGVIEDPTWFSAIHGADKDDDWTDPEVWAKANPNLGISVYPEFYESEFAQAKMSAAASLEFRRYHLCQWVDSAAGWLSVNEWDENLTERPELTSRSPVYIGVDLASTFDISAVSAVFPLEKGKFYTEQYFFFPEDGDMVKAGKTRKMDYTAWQEAGYMNLTPEGENGVDYTYILKKIFEIADKHSLQSIVIDPRAGGSYMATTIAEQGYDVVELSPASVARMSSSLTAFEALIRDGKITHDENPVMRWMIGNCSAEYDAFDNIKVTKRAASEKIDGVIATVLALDQALSGEKGLDSNDFKIRLL